MNGTGTQLGRNQPSPSGSKSVAGGRHLARTGSICPLLAIHIIDSLCLRELIQKRIEEAAQRR